MLTRIFERASHPMSRLHPVEFVLDVLCLQRGREVSAAESATLGYPIAGPHFVQDWAPFVSAVLSDELLYDIDNLKLRLVWKLDRVYREADVGLREAFLYVGQGLLENDGATWNDPTGSLRVFCARLGYCMNTASNIRDHLTAELIDLEGGVHSAFYMLGRELNLICTEHELTCRSLATREGAGQEPLPVFKAGGCQAFQDVSADPCDLEVLAADSFLVSDLCRPEQQPAEAFFSRRVRRAGQGQNGLPLGVAREGENGLSVGLARESQIPVGVFAEGGWRASGFPPEGPVRDPHGQAEQFAPQRAPGPPSAASHLEGHGHSDSPREASWSWQWGGSACAAPPSSLGKRRAEFLDEAGEN